MNRLFGPLTSLTTGWVLQGLRSLAQRLKESLTGLLPTHVTPVMTYADAIGYFVEHRPPDERVKKGAMLVEGRRDGKTVVQVFLSGEDQVLCHPGTERPYGRRILTRELDDELQAAFGATDVVIIE